MRLTKRARDNIWLLTFTDETGKRRRMSTGKRDRAEAEWEAQRMLTGTGGGSQGGCGYTVSEALDHAWARRWERQKSSRGQYYVVESLRREFGQRECRDLTYAVLEDYTARLWNDGLKPATINHRMGTLAVAFQMALKRNHIAHLPHFPRLRVDNVRLRYLTDAEEALLLGLADGIMRNLIVVLLDTGCRLSEVTGCQPADVVEGSLRLIETKNGKSRAVPLTQRAAASLRWLHADEKWRKITLRVSTSAVRKASAKDWCVKQFTKIRNEAELPDVSLHTLRHTCASRLVQRGIDLYRVKAWLGHSTIAMTERYAHLAPDALADVVDVLDKPGVKSAINRIKSGGFKLGVRSSAGQ